MAAIVDDPPSCGLCAGEADSTCRMLPCQHFYCTECILDHFRDQNRGEDCRRGRFVCPYCTRALPVNIEIPPVATEVNGDITGNEDEEKLNVADGSYCDICPQSKGLPTVCPHKQGLCQNKSLSSLQDQHPPSSLSSSSSSLSSASCHTHRLPIDKFCPDCAVCLCDGCWKGHGSPKTCPPPLPLSVAVTKRRTEARSLLDKAEASETNISFYKDEFHRQLESLNENMLTTSENIWFEVESLVSSLRTKARHLITEVELATEAEKSQLEGKMAVCDGHLEEVQDLKCQLSTLMSQSGGHQLVNNYPSLESRWETLNKCIKDIKSHNQVCVTAEFDADYRQTREKIKNLTMGRVRLTSKTTPAPTTSDRPLQKAPKWRHETAVQCILDIGDDGFSNQDRSPECGPSSPSRKIPSLSDLIEWPLVKSTSYITGLAVSEDRHIFVSDCHKQKILEYSPEGCLLCHCQTPSPPYDICAISPARFMVVLPWQCELMLLERSTDSKPFEIDLIVSTGEKRYYSLCKVGSTILACDWCTNVDILTSQGRILASVLGSRDISYQGWVHRICPGLRPDVFCLLDWETQTVSTYDLRGTLLLSRPTPSAPALGPTNDICFDSSGRLFCCDVDGIYCINETGLIITLWSFETKLSHYPRIALEPRHQYLFVSCKVGRKYKIRTFKIS